MSSGTLVNNWDALDPNKQLETNGPTAGMAGLIAEYRAQGRKKIDAAQGSQPALEDTVTGSNNDRLIADVISGKINLKTGEYNNSSGGSPLTREQGAEYLHTVYRLPATQQNTFITQTMGRTGVNFALDEARGDRLTYMAESSIGFRFPQLAMGLDHWATLSKNARRRSFETIFYDTRNPDPADAFITTLESLDHRYVGGALINYISNPLSTGITTEQFGRIVHYLSDANRKDGVNIHLIIDAPYTFASEILSDHRGRYLDSGMQDILTGVDNVDYTVILSLSKLFSLAKSGASIMMVNDRRAQDMNPTLADDGIGIARVAGYTEGIGELLADHTDLVWTRKEEVGKQYGDTSKMLDAAFSDQMIPGGRGMLRTQEIPTSAIFNKRVLCSDGNERIVRNGNHLATYLLDMHDVGLVSNGERQDPDKGEVTMIRYAARNTVEVAEQLVQQTQKGFDTLAAAPSVDPL